MLYSANYVLLNSYRKRSTGRGYILGEGEINHSTLASLLFNVNGQLKRKQLDWKLIHLLCCEPVKYPLGSLVAVTWETKITFQVNRSTFISAARSWHDIVRLMARACII